MKIALALSGMPRLYAESIESWNRILEKYNMDVYIHTWSQGEKFDLEIVNFIAQKFHPVSICFDLPADIDITPYPDRHWPYIDVYKSLSMWTSVNRVHSMITSSNKEYDIIVRARFDWYVDDLVLGLREAITIPHDPGKFNLQFTYKNTLVHGVNDLFSYGPVKYMEQYVKTLELIPELYKLENVDYCPENFLTASLIKQNTPVYFQPMNQRIIRG